MSTTPDVLDQLALLAPDRSTAQAVATDSLAPGAAAETLRRAARLDPGTSAGADLLMAVAARPRPRHRRTLAGLASATVLGVVVAAGAVVLPSDSPAGPSAAVAAQIEQLAIRAGETPADRVGPDQLVHTVDISRQDGSTGRYSSPRRDRKEAWLQADGGVWRRDTDGRTTHTYFFGPVWKPTLNSPTPEFLSTLPTDPDELREHLHENVDGSSSNDEAVFTAVEDMLRPGYGSPELRAAALRVLLTLPQVDVERDVRLPTGTTGTAIVWTESAENPDTDSAFTSVTKLLIDPATARVVGELDRTEGVERGQPFWSSYWSERVVADVVDDVPAAIRRTARVV